MELIFMKRTSSELKQTARGTLIGRYSLPIGAYLITFAVSFAVDAILSAFFPPTKSISSYITYLIASLITGLLLMLLRVGPTTILLDMSRGGRGQIKDVFYAFTHQPDRILLSQVLMSLICFACLLPCLFIFILGCTLGLTVFYQVVSFLLFLAGMALAYYLMLGYALVIPLYIDCPQMGVFQLLRESRMLMKGNKGRFFYLELSFIGISLLGILTCFVGLLWIIPYTELTTLEFYREAVGEI